MSILQSLTVIFTATTLTVYPLHLLSVLHALGAATFLTTAYLLFVCFIYPWYFSPFRHLPEPPNGSNFPWAHAASFLHEHNSESFRRWINEVPNDGLLRYRILFNQERLLVTSPEAVREITIDKLNEFAKPAQGAFMLRELIGNGILVAEGDEHKRQRKALLPAFSFRHIKDLYPVFWATARHVTEEISKANERAPHLPAQQAYDWASRATLDIIGSAAIGYDLNSVGDPTGEVISTYRMLFANEPPTFRWTFIGIWTPLELLYKLALLPVFRPIKIAASRIRDLGFDVVKAKRDELRAGKDSAVDIVSIAMRSGQFTDEDLVNQIMTFMAAGHETTASALTWATYLLCLHQDIQARLREEVRSHLPSIRDPATNIVASQIDNLPYLNAVCNEVLRCMPSVPMTVRDAVVDTTLLGHRIPKGTRVVLSAWAINQSVELWGPDAANFDPERWMGDAAANSGGAKNNFANMTFLHGPRGCIGKDFSKAELKCLLAAWIGRFEVTWEGGKPLPEDVHGWVTVRPGHKLPVIFREIDGW